MRLVTNEASSLRQFAEQCSGATHGRGPRPFHLRYSIALPPVSAKRMKKLQSQAEAATNDAVFTRALRDLFELLSAWEGDCRIRLEVLVQSPSDNDGELLASLHNSHPGEPIWTVRSEFKYINLDPAVLPDLRLPVAKALHALEFQWRDWEYRPLQRRLHPSIIPVLALAAPNASAFVRRCAIPSYRLATPRQEIRSALPQALQQAPFDSLTRLDIEIEDVDLEDQTREPTAFCKKGRKDDLSRAVRRIFHLPAITTVNLTGRWCLSPTDAFSITAGRPFGPSLRTVVIEGAATTPTGQWLSRGYEDWDSLDFLDVPYEDEELSPAEFDSEDSDTSDFLQGQQWAIEAGELPRYHFRVNPDGRVFPAHVIPVVRAVRAMPALRHLEYSPRAPCQVALQYWPPGVESIAARKGRMRFARLSTRPLVPPGTRWQMGLADDADPLESYEAIDMEDFAGEHPNCHIEPFQEHTARPRWHIYTMERQEKLTPTWRVPLRLRNAMKEGGAAVTLFAHGDELNTWWEPL